MISSEEDTSESIPVEREDTGPVEWDVDMEIQLFYAMANHKPVGINKHFHMACIFEKLSSSIRKKITTKDIWDHLGTLYDLAMLDETEPIPFPNHEVPFSLDEDEYGELMRKKRLEVMSKETVDLTEGGGSSSSSPILTPSCSSPKPSTSKDIMPKAAVTAAPQSLPAVAARKDSVSAVSTKARKESGSSHASTDTQSTKSDYERRRDSRDSNASGPKESSGRKSVTQRDKVKNKASPVVSAWDTPPADEDNGRRGRRRANTSTPPAITPAKRRRT